MRKGTAEPTYNVLYEEGDYKIIENDQWVSFYERNSVIIHKCPNRDQNLSHHISQILINQETSECWYCKQPIPEAMKSLYILHNFDCFASDSHEAREMAPGRVYPLKKTL